MQHSTVNTQTTPDSWAHEANHHLSSLKQALMSGDIDSGSALKTLRKLYRQTPRTSIRSEHYIYLTERSTEKAEYSIPLEDKIRDLLTVFKTAEDVWQTLESTFPKWETAHPREAASVMRFDDLLPDIVQEFEKMLAVVSDPRGFMCEDDKQSEARKTFSAERNSFIGARDKLFQWIIPSANTPEALGTLTDEQRQERETRKTMETKDIGAQLQKSLEAFKVLEESWDEFASLHKDWETRWPKAAQRAARWDDTLPSMIDKIAQAMTVYGRACIDGRLSTSLSTVTNANPEL